VIRPHRIRHRLSQPMRSLAACTSVRQFARGSQSRQRADDFEIRLPRMPRCFAISSTERRSGPSRHGNRAWKTESLFTKASAFFRLGTEATAARNMRCPPAHPRSGAGWLTSRWKVPVCSAGPHGLSIAEFTKAGQSTSHPAGSPAPPPGCCPMAGQILATVKTSKLAVSSSASSR
jgi:hypothetical protein